MEVGGVPTAWGSDLAAPNGHSIQRYTWATKILGNGRTSLLVASVVEAFLQQAQADAACCNYKLVDRAIAGCWE